MTYFSIKILNVILPNKTAFVTGSQQADLDFWSSTNIDHPVGLQKDFFPWTLMAAYS